ncbi:hypothetical protein [Robbsia sp. KACC 23696]|uniref:hypothetical protein n=1 Tax=Robbsia sp. KACC 23696 TaxID=3149231 RepID=UPI00325BD2F7
MTRIRILPRPSLSEPRGARPILRKGLRRAGMAGVLLAATIVLGGCAGSGGGGAQSANGISMYGTIDQGVSFRSR